MDSNGFEKNDVVTERGESNLAETKYAKLSSYVINLLFSKEICAGGPKRKKSRVAKEFGTLTSPNML